MAMQKRRWHATGISGNVVTSEQPVTVADGIFSGLKRWRGSPVAMAVDDGGRTPVLAAARFTHPATGR